jgi:hypothetical protein
MKALSMVLAAMLMTAAVCTAAETAGFSFLQIPVGARAVAMGGAFTAVAGDPASLYWNPAAAITIDGDRITTHYTGYLMDMQAGFAGWVGPRENDAIGVAVNYFYGGSFERTTVGDPMGTGDEFSANSIALAGTYARHITPEIAAGISGRFIYSSIDTYSGNAFSVDLGALWSPSALPWGTAGLVVRNAGIQTKAFYRENDPMPTEVAVGAAGTFMDGDLMITADGTYPFNGDANAALGVEYRPIDLLALRAGGNMRDMDAGDAAGGGFVDGLAFGMGTHWRSLQLDYSFKPFAELGSIHRISLGLSM